jgi:hypothetical protein
MVNVSKVANFIYNLSVLYNPEIISWEDWEEVRHDWYDQYKDNRVVVANKVLKAFEKKYKGTSRNTISPEAFGDYKKDLYKFRDLLLQEVEEHYYKIIDKKKFFNYIRMERVTAQLSDLGLANCLRDHVYIEPMRLSKEEIKELIKTFCYCFEYLADRINKKEINKEVLNQLGLPLVKEELQLLVETTNDLGELFNWNKTVQGFWWWADIYLKREKDSFKQNVYSYLESLHPDVSFPKVVIEQKPRLEIRTGIGKPVQGTQAYNAVPVYWEVIGDLAQNEF